MVDFCDCTGLYVTALHLLLKKNKGLELVQLSGCTNGVDDQAMHLFSKLEDLELLDISYCKKVSDAGTPPFGQVQLPITQLALNGVNGLSSAGVNNILTSCSGTLVDLELANMDQDSFKNDVMNMIGKCWSLETLDLAGALNLDDQAFAMA